MKKIFLALILTWWPCVSLARSYSLKVDPAASALTLHGDSTLHRFSSTATVVNATASLETAAADASLSQAFQDGKPALALTVQVSGLKSGKSGLDENMYKALKAAKFPEIRFILSSLKTVPEPLAAGSLTIAGVSRPIEFQVAFAASEETLTARGSYDLKMSDYGIKPPKMMLGAIKTRDEITIRFEVTFKPTSESHGGVQ